MSERRELARPRSAVALAALCGLLAGLIAAAYFSVAGEPWIDEAIAIEEAEAAAHPDHAGDDGSDGAVEVSRSTQRGVGLFAAMGLAGAAFGALLGVAWWALRRRQPEPFRRALLAGAILATSITVVPWLKYPPNPPAVGDPDTINQRQGSYVALIVLTGLAWFLALAVADRLSARGRPAHEAWLGAAGALLGPVALALAVLPPQDLELAVPANLIWQFRIASLAGNVLLWTLLVAGFGWLAVRRTPALPRGDVDHPLVSSGHGAT